MGGRVGLFALDTGLWHDDVQNLFRAFVAPGRGEGLFPTITLPTRRLLGLPFFLLLGLAMAPVLGGIGAVIGAPPIAILGALVSWLVYPRHPKARALERYEAAAALFRPCDVCRLAQGDSTPREGVTYCGRCEAWICPACRRRYDLRAIAALKRGSAPGGNSAA